MSWREFRFNLRPISLLRHRLRGVHHVAVAAATHWLLGFSVAGRLRARRHRLAARRGGAAVDRAPNADPEAHPGRSRRRRAGERRHGPHSLPLRGGRGQRSGIFVRRGRRGHFVAILVGEILWGIGVGWLMLRLRRWVRDPRIEIMLSMLTPFLAYWPPEQFGGSGVLATVTAGLYISWNGLRADQRRDAPAGRFLLGLPRLPHRGHGVSDHRTADRARSSRPSPPIRFPASRMSAAVVGVVVIAARFGWVYPSTYISPG